MKKILFIAPDSFPVKSAESIVNIKLLKALTNSNSFEIDLISKRDYNSIYTSNSLEEYGVKLNSLNIIEVENKVNISTIFQHIKAYFLFGTVFKGAHWAAKALAISKKLVKSNRYDYVLTKSRSAPLVGYYLKKKYGMKWVATWNDPTPEIKYPSPYGKGFDCNVSYLQNKYISEMAFADFHVFPNSRLRDYMLRYLPVPINKTIIIPHVVLKDDIHHDSIINSQNVLKLIHSGNLGGARNPETFFAAFGKFIKEDGNKKVQLDLLGIVNKSIEEFVDKKDLNSYVHFLKPVPYLDSLKLLSNYHIAIIIEANCSEGVFLPTKVGDFMQNNKVIFTISPENGLLHDLHNEGYIQYYADVNSVDSIYKALKKIYSDFASGSIENSLKIVPDYLEDNVVEKYSNII